jgi:hypothetical protein
MKHELIGQTIGVSLQPYQAGTAKVIDVRPSVVYGTTKPAGGITIEVEAVEMTETSRLFGASSTRPVTPGTKYQLHFHECQMDRIIAEKRADYVYPV